MSTKTSQGLVAYAKAQIGKPYWYGTYGNIATENLLNNKVKKYPSIYTSTRIVTAKSQHMGQRVHDDVGLIKGYLWSSNINSIPIYNSSQDLSTAEFYSHSDSKGTIAGMPHIEGILVFRGSSPASISHVGIYDGDKYVYEAKGFEYGVVRTTFSYNDWNYYAYCPFITYNTTVSKSNINTYSTNDSDNKKGYEIKTKAGTWYLRKAPTTSSIIVKVLDGNTVYYASKKTSGWYYIDSLKGYINAIGVNEVNKNTPKILYKLKIKAGTWTIRSVPSVNGEIVTRISGNQTLESSSKNKDWYYVDSLNGYINTTAVSSSM